MKLPIRQTTATIATFGVLTSLTACGMLTSADKAQSETRDVKATPATQTATAPSAWAKTEGANTSASPTASASTKPAEDGAYPDPVDRTINEKFTHGHFQISLSRFAFPEPGSDRSTLRTGKAIVDMQVKNIGDKPASFDIGRCMALMNHRAEGAKGYAMAYKSRWANTPIQPGQEQTGTAEFLVSKTSRDQVLEIGCIPEYPTIRVMMSGDPNRKEEILKASLTKKRVPTAPHSPKEFAREKAVPPGQPIVFGGNVEINITAVDRYWKPVSGLVGGAPVTHDVVVKAKAKNTGTGVAATINQLCPFSLSSDGRELMHNSLLRSAAPKPPELPRELAPGQEVEFGWTLRALNNDPQPQVVRLGCIGSEHAYFQLPTVEDYLKKKK